jgi:hypothetical protein
MFPVDSINVKVMIVFNVSYYLHGQMENESLHAQ